MAPTTKKAEAPAEESEATEPEATEAKGARGARGAKAAATEAEPISDVDVTRAAMGGQAVMTKNEEEGREERHPHNSRPLAMLGDQPAVTDGSTFHTPIVAGAPPDPGDPGLQLVMVTEEKIRTFTYPNSTRPSRQLVAAAGTLMTRRTAEEADLQYTEVNP